jgi:hypothetical protein
MFWSSARSFSATEMSHNIGRMTYVRIATRNPPHEKAALGPEKSASRQHPTAVNQ